VFFWNKVEESVGAEHARIANSAILDAAIIIDGITEDPNDYHNGWAEAFYHYLQT